MSDRQPGTVPDASIYPHQHGRDCTAVVQSARATLWVGGGGQAHPLHRHRAFIALIIVSMSSAVGPPAAASVPPAPPHHHPSIVDEKIIRLG